MEWLCCFKNNNFMIRSASMPPSGENMYNRMFLNVAKFYFDLLSNKGKEK